MPLTTCPDCNREVSTSARHCVHCGRPWPASRCGGAGALVIGLLVAFCVFGGIALAKAKHCRAETRCRVERTITPTTTTTTPAPAEAPKPAAAPVKEEE
jgi:hypothetical protein